MSSRKLISLGWLLSLLAIVANAQSTAFTHQGRLTDNGAAASGAYDLQFALFDALSGGAQQGATITRDDVPVTNGVFTVALDFGAAPFTGVARFLQISVRTGASTGAFTLLNPRQPLSATPYAVRSQAAASADNATQLGGVAASQYVQTADTRLTDARNPTAGSTNYVQNTTTPQAASSFNISGNGTAGGTLSGNVVNAAAQFNLNGARMLSNPGELNLFAGGGAGAANTSGGGNAFVGASAGQANTTGLRNAFFGTVAGAANTAGSDNTFAGALAGQANTTGGNNAFFGASAGQANTSGGFNSFFGARAGQNVTTGSGNVFIGNDTGLGVTTGSSNTALGSGANVAGNFMNGNLTFATAIGAGASVTASNTIMLGRLNGSDRVIFPGPITASSISASGVISTGGGLTSAGLISANGGITATGGISANGILSTGPLTSTGPITGNGITSTGPIFANGGLTSEGVISAIGGITSQSVIFASGGIVLNQSQILLRGGGDGNHLIAYDPAIDGIQFRAFDRFRWVRGNGNTVQMTLQGNGNLELRGALLSGSDARYKTNVQTLPQALDQVLRLRGVSYQWKPEFNRDDRTQIGFIAQEVEAVLPELVSTDDKGFKSVAYANAVPVLVEALKEQQRRFAAENATLKAQLAALAERLTQLEQQAAPRPR